MYEIIIAGQLQNEMTSWKAPSISKYKVNMDMALFTEQGCAGVGVVIG